VAPSRAVTRLDQKALPAANGGAFQIIPNGTEAPGPTQALLTKDGSVMTVSYSNSESDDQEQSGAQLRVAAFGPYAVNFPG
jgi:alkaline phosphatase